MGRSGFAWGPRCSLMAGAAPSGAGLSWSAGTCGRSGKGRMRLGGAVRRRASTEALFEARRCRGGESQQRYCRFDTLGDPTVSAERGGAGRRGVRPPGKGGLGDVGLGTRGWRGVMGRDSGGGEGWCGWGWGSVRRGLGRGGLAGWGVPGLHRARIRSSAGGTPSSRSFFGEQPGPQLFCEQPPGGACWAAAVRVRNFAVAEIAIHWRF